VPGGVCEYQKGKEEERRGEERNACVWIHRKVLWESSGLQEFPRMFRMGGETATPNTYTHVRSSPCSSSGGSGTLL